MSNIQTFRKIVPFDVDMPKLRTLYNQVVVEMNVRENEKTIGGLYAPLRIEDVDKAADFVPRKGKVVKVPDHLYYDKKVQNSMIWKTKMELQIGDEVWMNFTIANDFEFRDGKKLYKSVHYQDIILAQRERQIIMLNGYILLSPIYREEKILDHSVKKVIKDQGIVSFLGSVNEEYKIPEYVSFGKTIFRSDPQGLKIGDSVQISKKHVKKLRYLEYGPFNKLDGKSYLVAQRYMLAARIKD